MPPLDPRRSLGRVGETLAAQALVERGYTIVEHNWRCPSGELDIIARDGDCLVFVEVRTRRGGWRGAAADSVGPKKQAKLAVLADAYLQSNKIPVTTDWRIDVVTVELDHRGVLRSLDVFKDAVGWR